MLKKRAIVGITLLLLIIFIVPSTGKIGEKTVLIDIEGSLEKIQESQYKYIVYKINNPCSGDTQFVYNASNRTYCHHNHSNGESHHFGSIKYSDSLSPNGMNSDGIGTTNINNSYFYGQSNKSIYVITVSSTNEIIIENFTYNVSYYIFGEKTTGGAFFEGCYYTNGTSLNLLSASAHESYYDEGHLRYLSVKFGNFNYKYENRSLFNWSGDFGYILTNNRLNLSLSPGKWHFIFTGGIFDLQQDDVLLDISVWMNFSNNPDDLEISTSEGGTIYALWYGEFDANILVSKTHILEMMLNGEATFHINNTFIYDFLFFPICQGFWRIKWVTPEGTNRFNMLLLRNREIYNRFKENKCISGIGPSGDYTLITSYLDYVPILFRNRLERSHALPIYFVGLDVNLP